MVAPGFGCGLAITATLAHGGAIQRVDRQARIGDRTAQDRSAQ